MQAFAVEYVVKGVGIVRSELHKDYKACAVTARELAKTNRCAMKIVKVEVQDWVATTPPASLRAERVEESSPDAAYEAYAHNTEVAEQPDLPPWY